MTWCGQCFASLAPPEDRRPAQPLAMTRVYSRWHGSPTSFGPTGRVLATLLVVLFEYWLWKFNLLGFAITMVTVVPLVLRDVWKRTPVHLKNPKNEV